MSQEPLYQVLAQHIAWQPTEACRAQRDDETKRCLDALPSGSGWDSGTKLDDRSTPNRIILYGEYHHMSEHGYYEGWTAHEIIVTASLAHGFDLRVTGRNRNEIKDYLAEMFDQALRQPIDEWCAPREEASV